MKYHQQNFVVTPEVLDLITRMAEKRFTQPMMAEGLGISINTWYNLKKNNPDIKLILQNAKMIQIDHVKDHLINIIDDPKHPKHFNALVWFLSRYDPEARMDNTEKPEVEDTTMTEEELMAKIQELARKTFGKAD
ncbi:MAG TPA: hypothetical protein VFM18_05865 [Methanosarcina sp.]|nr:hypothetical protein [Methanosarcina sp.]